MTPPLTPRPDCPLEPPAAAETTSTQLFGVLYITLTGLVDSMVPNSGPWSFLGQSTSYIIKLAPILWWALPTGLAVPHPKLPNASAYDWLPDNKDLEAAFATLAQHKLLAKPSKCQFFPGAAVLLRPHSLKRWHYTQQSEDPGHLQNAATQRQVGTPHILKNGCLCTLLYT
ncbi:hypothetical protein DSO57_1029341 [Entomophthora muscae]|uniref:Uncharacterized protein n=1 Tax=Entomophthora muscae TaxID=34485 RepID=A0ACC2TCK6_9FUNG|nr:hypothetical protein DSO57_1029341 [Entomophthora muscae]